MFGWVRDYFRRRRFAKRGHTLFLFRDHTGLRAVDPLRAEAIIAGKLGPDWASAFYEAVSPAEFPSDTAGRLAVYREKATQRATVVSAADEAFGFVPYDEVTNTGTPEHDRLYAVSQFVQYLGAVSGAPAAGGA